MALVAQKVLVKLAERLAQPLGGVRRDADDCRGAEDVHERVFHGPGANGRLRRLDGN